MQLMWQCVVGHGGNKTTEINAVTFQSDHPAKVNGLF